MCVSMMSQNYFFLKLILAAGQYPGETSNPGELAAGGEEEI